MTLAAAAFVLLLVLGVPIAFTILGASVVYFTLYPLMASIVAQRMASSLRAFRCWQFRSSSSRAPRWPAAA